MKYYIYKIINKLNGKSYVGQHKIPDKPEAFRRYMGKGIAIKEAIKKYGKENFDKVILEEIEDDEKHELVSERERFWISAENTIYPFGYNISLGGEGGCTKESAAKGALTRKRNGYTHSEETKKKISESNKGKPKSEIHKQHLSENHRTKTLHTICFEDGRPNLETYTPLIKIAEEYLGNPNMAAQLRRRSSKGEFYYGIKILECLGKNYK